MSAPAPIRYVVFHLPGPAWRKDLTPFEQPGVAEHFSYVQAAFEDGRIELAGPFLVDGAGGMVITSKDTTEAEAIRLGGEDPGVRSGLIRAEVRPWMTTLR
jgi:uncharacterized protein YciI